MNLLEKEISLKLIQGETIIIIDNLTLLRVEKDLQFIMENCIQVLKQIKKRKKNKK